MTKEEWKAIPEFEGYYEASNLGRIRSVERIVKSGKGSRTVPSVVLKPSVGEYGYESVSLSMNNKQYMQRVNRLVAQAFIDNPNNLPQVNHIDGDKTNNCVENLEWCDGSYNMQHCYANKLTDWGTKIRIVETNEEFNSIVECARKIGNNSQLGLEEMGFDFSELGTYYNPSWWVVFNYDVFKALEILKRIKGE